VTKKGNWIENRIRAEQRKHSSLDWIKIASLKIENSIKEKYIAHKKNRLHKPKQCKYCKEWYKEVIERTKLIKNKKVREALMETWETLWLNNCSDFDIIAHCFYEK